jgi:acetyl esterase/lipase
MKQINLLVIFILGAVAHVYAQEFIPLWPKDKKPNFNGHAVTDSLYNERIWRVATPGIYAFPAAKALNTGTTVLICPGGGYERLSHIYNGFVVAAWFNARGINAYVLIYRLPHQSDLQDRALAPLQDVQRAIKILRFNAKKWNLQTDKIGVFGASAGGHVASTAGTHLTDVAAIKDEMDTVSFKPDFMILVSPVISMGDYAHRGSRQNLLGKNPSKEQLDLYSNELQVSALTPPAFMVHAQNDSTVQ